ncbi:MAG: tetratricopeptide repeat protein [Nitrospirae bacterium]|nr:tetratricopeptide repeat protein [Nitrospirota bacterium]
MKFFLLFLPFFLILCESPGKAQEFPEASSNLLKEFKVQIERYRIEAQAPPFEALPADPDLLKYENGLNFFRMGDGYSAIQTFKALSGSKKTSQELKKEVHATLGYIFLEQKRPKEAMEEFTAIEKEPGLEEKARFGIAWSFMEMEEYVKAIALLEDLLPEFPEGEYAQENLLRTGFCYSKLLAYRNALESYQKALNTYNRQSQSRKTFIKKLEQPAPFNREFIFNNPDPEWRRLLARIDEDPNGRQMIQWAASFLNMEDALYQARPGFKQESSEIRRNLLPIRSKIRNLFDQFIREEAALQQKTLEAQSVQAAVELAKILILEKSETGKGGAPP